MSNKQQDEIELSLVEGLRVFHRKRALAFKLLSAGLLVSLIIPIFFISPKTTLSLEYKVKSLSLTDITHLGHTLTDEARFQSFLKEMGLNRSFFSGKNITTAPFDFHEVEVKGSKTYDSFTVDIHATKVSLDTERFLPLFNRLIISDGFNEFYQSRSLFNFLTSLSKDKLLAKEEIREINDSLPYDRMALSELSKMTNSNESIPAPSLHINVNTFQMSLNAEGELIEKPDKIRSNFVGRYLLPIPTQKSFMESIISDKEVRKKHLLKKIQLKTQTINIISEVIKSVPLDKKKLEKLKSKVSNMGPEVAMSLQALLDDEMLNDQSGVLLITPKAKTKSNFSSRIKLAFILFSISLIFIIVSVFFADFWDANKASILNKD